MSLLDSNKPIATPALSSRRAINSQFAILKHKSQLLTILTLLFVCVIGWVVVSLFASQQKSKIDVQLSKLAQPLTPSLDLETLNLLENKRSFTDEELANFTIYRVYVDPRSRTEQIIPIDQALPTATPRSTPRVAASPEPVTQ